jgi:hypothetical protein
MPSVQSVFALIGRKFDDIGLDRAHYTLGDSYVDDRYCLYQDGENWCVGWNERGKRWETSRFKDDLAAAEYLLFLLLKRSESVNFPEIDWTEYAALP